MRIAADALLPEGTLAAALHREAILLLGGPRALLMQLAHPAVAQGVAEHSDFRADPFSRLRRTLEVMTTISFAPRPVATATLAGLRAVHDRVEGTLPDGRPYHANDPELLLWVHATLVDTVLEVERRYLGRLGRGERAAYYAETVRLARAFEIPDALIPADLSAFDAYMADQVATLEVSDTARDLAHAVLHPPVPFLPSQVWEPLRLVTVDMLPRRVREGYALGWDGRRKRVLRAAQAGMRAVLPRLPELVRRLPSRARPDPVGVP